MARTIPKRAGPDHGITGDVFSRRRDLGTLPAMSETALTCGFCARAMAYVHGHAACVNNQCPMYGVNQAECCSGEVACPTVLPRAPRPEKAPST
jgi:hypothetical protein